jgi:hypothetical protein
MMGADILRVHDPGPTVAALAVAGSMIGKVDT